MDDCFPIKPPIPAIKPPLGEAAECSKPPALTPIPMEVTIRRDDNSLSVSWNLPEPNPVNKEEKAESLELQVSIEKYVSI